LFSWKHPTLLLKLVAAAQDFSGALLSKFLSVIGYTAMSFKGFFRVMTHDQLGFFAVMLVLMTTIFNPFVLVAIAIDPTAPKNAFMKKGRKK
jgi:hypothetical protein